MKRIITFFTVLLFAHLSVISQNSKEPVKVTDMLKIKSISGITLNNDGTKAAFTVTVIEPDGESKVDYKYVNHIYVVPADGSSAPKELTVKESSSQPAWSPDGKKLAFVRAVDGKPQVFLLSFDGGEPIQLTHYKYGAGTPKWSPDGKEILFSSNINLKDLVKDSLLNPTHAVPLWPMEKPGMSNEEAVKTTTAKANPDGNIDEIRAYLENDVTDKKAKVVTKLNFQDEMNVNGDVTFNHFFKQAAQPDAQAVAVTHGFYRYLGADFTPDGKQLIITADIDSALNPDRSLESEIYIADGNGNNLQLLLGEKSKSYNSPAVSPSGKWLAFQYGPTSFVSVPVLAIMPLKGAAKDIIEIPFDRAKGNYTWSNDEKYLYFSAQSNGGAPVFRVNLQTKKVEQLSDYNSGIGSFDVKNNHLVYAKTEVADPFELYNADAAMQNAKAISTFNSDWIKNKQLIFPEKHEFKNNKGETIEYWVMKPLNFDKSKKYPLLLDIHGGPSALWGPGESSMWHEFQFFCAKGYGVVYCNPRGSGGYGLDFLRANINDWGTGPTSDVLTALDKTVSEGWADTSKLVVSGGSYAGYLVAWIIAHDHRFKAACSQRGVYDLATFFGEGNAWRLVPNYFGGYPWEAEAKANLERESPITYVQNITTPYIIFHGENDRRTGFVEGEMLYRSLKVLGRPVEYVRHPGGTHELTRSGDNRQRIDQMLRTYEFFERWVNKK
ncbi:MAG: S9 family peptidase [Bacteroidetes bacterium]|nr:S9 family peptidase [Bacteroidota bacterium]